MSSCIRICEAADAFGHFLWNWQTLISGSLALGAAIWAGSLLQRQISQSEAFHKDTITQRQNAARTVLPLALSSIDQLCRRVSDQIGHEYEARANFDAAFDAAAASANARKHFDPVTLPDGVAGEIKAFVETLRGPRSVRHVAELMSSLQILLSRFNSFDLTKGDEIVKIELSNLLLDTAKVVLLNDKMYNFGRFLDDKFAIVGRVPDAEAWDLIHEKATALIILRKIPDIFFEPLAAKVERCKASGSSPWLQNRK